MSSYDEQKSIDHNIPFLDVKDGGRNRGRGSGRVELVEIIILSSVSRVVIFFLLVKDREVTIIKLSILVQNYLSLITTV